MTVREAAAYSKRADATVFRALRSGELRGGQNKKGADWRIHREDLDAWISGANRISA